MEMWFLFVPGLKLAMEAVTRSTNIKIMKAACRDGLVSIWMLKSTYLNMACTDLSRSHQRLA